MSLCRKTILLKVTQYVTLVELEKQDCMGLCLLKSSGSGLPPILTAVHTPSYKHVIKFCLFITVFYSILSDRHHYFEGDNLKCMLHSYRDCTFECEVASGCD
jgi:hypothetical protein